MEYLDICDEKGQPTGEVVERSEAHRLGIRHRTAHVWVLRREGKRVQLLLQKRSAQKESFPGLYDTSSAGHIPAGEEPLDSARRELQEELGIDAAPEELCFIGILNNVYEKRFHSEPFRDNEYCHVYVYTGTVESSALRVQPEEVERVDWFDVEELRREIACRRARFCVPPESLKLLCRWLEREDRVTDGG